MPARPDPLTLAAGAAVTLCVAFIASFIFGLRAGGSPAPGPADAGPWQNTAPPVAGRVEVLNASGRSGMARTAMDRLRAGGFDVVYFGNAPAAHAGDSSVVLARYADDAVARAAARYLGIPRVTTRIDTTLFLDATIIIGRDWPTGGPPEPPTPDGWRARIGRWLRPS